MSHPEPRPTLHLALTLYAILTLLAVAAAASAHAGAHPTLQAVPAAEQLTVFGGGCGASCDDDEDDDGGGGGGGGGRNPYPVGSAYWVTTDRNLISESFSSADLADEVNNRTDRDLTYRFSYTYSELRRVGFSGGFADYFEASIGGETNYSTTRSLTASVPSRHKGKLYTKERTRRYEVRGAKYQDYSDGSRTRLDRDSGPYRKRNTVTGFVTRPL